jgi:hypothetical protein
LLLRLDFEEVRFALFAVFHASYTSKPSVSRRTVTLFSCVPIAFSIFPDHFGVSSRISPCFIFKRCVWCDVAVYPSFSCNTCRISPHSCNFCPSVVVFLLFGLCFFFFFRRIWPRFDLLSWCVCVLTVALCLFVEFHFFYIFLKRFWGLSRCVLFLAAFARAHGGGFFIFCIFFQTFQTVCVRAFGLKAHRVRF